jgi:hypothetical protein
MHVSPNQTTIFRPHHRMNLNDSATSLYLAPLISLCPNVAVTLAANALLVRRNESGALELVKPLRSTQDCHRFPLLYLRPHDCHQV